MGYNNHSVQEIKANVEQEFKKIEKINAGRSGLAKVRDDLELLQAGRNVINAMIKKMIENHKEITNNSLADLHKLRNSYKKESKGLSGWLITSSEYNQKLINKIANEIDNAENKLLDNLDSDKADYDARKSQESQKRFGKEYFKYSISEKERNLTNEVNALNFRQLDKYLKLGKMQYEISYVRCANSKVRSEMRNILGPGLTGWIERDGKQKAYFLRDKNGNKTAIEPKLWQGVSLKQSEGITATIKKQNRIIQQQTKQEWKNGLRMNKNTSVEDLERHAYWGSIIMILKDSAPNLYQCLKKDPSLMKKFLTVVESRLDILTIQAKKLNYTLHAEPVSTVFGGVGEIHLIARDGTVESDRKIFDYKDHKQILGSLYGYLDSHEDQFVKFVTSRIRTKFEQTYAHLTKNEKISIEETKNRADVLSPQELESAKEGLGLIYKTLQQIREDKKDTWLTDDDKRISKLMTHIDNALYTLNNSQGSISKISYNQKIIDVIAKEWNGLSSIFYQQYGYNKAVLTQAFADFKTNNLEKMRSAVRAFGNIITVKANTYTSHLADDIIHEKGIVLNNASWNKWFHRIKEVFEIGEDGPTVEQKKRIDALYEAKDGRAIVGILKNNNIIPQSSMQDEFLEEQCIKLKAYLDAKREQLKSLKISVTSVKTSYQQERLKLLHKGNLTEDEKQRLQVLTVMLSDPNIDSILNTETQQIYQDTINQIKYMGIDNDMRSTVGSYFIKKANGLKSGKNISLYNDIKGYGPWYNFSDENAVIAQEMIQMVVEEIVITAAVVALTPATGGASMGFLAARRAGKLATKSKTLVKFGRIVSRIGNVIQKSARFKKVVGSLRVVAKPLSQLGYSRVAELVKSGARSFARGSMHTLISNSYRGKIDDDFEGWMSDILQSSGSYAITGLFNRISTMGGFSVLAKKRPKYLSADKKVFHMTSFLVEELSMNAKDLAINVIMDADNSLLSLEDFQKNLAIAVAFKFMKTGSNDAMNKTKATFHFGKTHKIIEIDGVRYKIDDLGDDLVKYYKTRKGGKDTAVQDRGFTEVHKLGNVPNQVIDLQNKKNFLDVLYKGGYKDADGNIWTMFSDNKGGQYLTKNYRSYGALVIKGNKIVHTNHSKGVLKEFNNLRKKYYGLLDGNNHDGERIVNLWYHNQLEALSKNFDVHNINDRKLFYELYQIGTKMGLMSPYSQTYGDNKQHVGKIYNTLRKSPYYSEWSILEGQVKEYKNQWLQ